MSAASIYQENDDGVLLVWIYRTNRFNMPLLNIVGVTRMTTTIHIAQGFMTGETASDYEWALQQLVSLQANLTFPRPDEAVGEGEISRLLARMAQERC